MVDFGERRHHFAAKAVLSLRPRIRYYNDSNNSSIRRSWDLPTLVLHYNLFAHQEAWRKSPVDQPSQLIYLDEFHKFDTRSFDIKICPSEYTSHDVFYTFLQQHLTNWGDYYEASDDYLIKKMMSYIHIAIEGGSKKVPDSTNYQYLEIFLDVNLKLEYVLDGRMSGIPWRLNGGMVPSTKTSIAELPERMEIVDDQCLKDIDCVICLEQIEGAGKIVCMPCSHMFHRHCITTWLDKSHYCPICRYDLPTN